MHQKKLLVFTDLDGTVLDHYSYSHALAEPMLRVFMRENIPVIPVSSKTRAELEPLRVALENHHPFIVENGAGICIPENYFSDMPSGYEFINGYWQKGFSRPRAFWQACLRKLQPEFESDFISFSMAGTQGIAKMTGLSLEEAEQANQRQYSEPLLWRGSPERRNYFLRCLQDMDVRAVQGGRFLQLLMKIRIKQEAFHPNATQYTLQLGSRLFGFWRQSSNRIQSIFCISNISDQPAPLLLSDLNLISTSDWTDLISKKHYSDLHETVVIQPYETLWLANC